MGDGFGLLRQRQISHAARAVGRSASVGVVYVRIAGQRGIGCARGLHRVGGGVVGDLRRRVDRIEIVDCRRVLRRLGVIRAGRAILVDNSLGKKIIDVFAIARHICREQMIECAVFTDYDNNMLDGAVRFAVVGARSTDRAAGVGIAPHDRQYGSGYDSTIA